MRASEIRLPVLPASLDIGAMCSLHLQQSGYNPGLIFIQECVLPVKAGNILFKIGF